jgi:hypothetical protein
MIRARMHVRSDAIYLRKFVPTFVSRVMQTTVGGSRLHCGDAAQPRLLRRAAPALRVCCCEGATTHTLLPAWSTPAVMRELSRRRHAGWQRQWEQGKTASDFSTAANVHAAKNALRRSNKKAEARARHRCWALLGR